MTRRFGKVLLGMVLVGAAAHMIWSTQTSSRPQQVRAAPLAADPSPHTDVPVPATGQVPIDPPAVSVQDALLRRVDLPFAEPTTLLDVQKYLGETLGLAVVLDRAALTRLDVDAEDTVQLNIRGVRLKTGLKLLLDQVEMTYRVEAEDNLLILTDAREAVDPTIRALQEIKALHQEVHELQDAVDDLRDLVEEDLGFEPGDTENISVFVRGRTRSPAGRLTPRSLRRPAHPVRLGSR